MAIDIQSVIEELRSIELDEIRADNIGRWPLVVRVFACVLAFLAVLLAFYFLKVKDLNSTLESDARQEVVLRKQVVEITHDAANLDAYKAQLVELEARLETLIGQLPTDTEVPGLLEDVTETGLNSGLQIQSIELQNEVSHDYYLELPIQIEAVGGYHDFAGFVSGVAGLPRIVTLHDFTIDDQGQNLLSMSILAKTYRYKPVDDGSGGASAN